MEHSKFLRASSIKHPVRTPRIDPEQQPTGKRANLTDSDNAIDEGRTDDNDETSAAEAQFMIAWHNCFFLRYHLNTRTHEKICRTKSRTTISAPFYKTDHKSQEKQKQRASKSEKLAPIAWPRWNGQD